MPISFECNAGDKICSNVEGKIRLLLDKAGFDGEAEIRVVIGKPGKCAGACVFYNTELDEKLALFNALSSIFTFALGESLGRKGATCKFWLADGLGALLATKLIEAWHSGFSKELERMAGGLVDERLLEERFGILRLTGPGMIVPSTGKSSGDIAKAAMITLEYLNSTVFRVSAAKVVEEKLGHTPTSWTEVVRGAENLCTTRNSG